MFYRGLTVVQRSVLPVLKSTQGFESRKGMPFLLTGDIHVTAARDSWQSHPVS